ncbi:MAG TPA: NUDIX hydrolase [Acidimicrobiales bacterium]|nr:NUDIX hydrolase [Acidimicrobiales bacterium]
MPSADASGGGEHRLHGRGGFRRLDEREVFRSRVFWVGELQLADPDGRPFTRHVVHHPGAVAVVAVDATGTVTLVRQYRAAVGAYVLEVPAGTCDEHGEALEDTARRELAEEAGLRAGELTRLTALYNTPGYSDQVTTVFLATRLTPCPTARAGIEERYMDLEAVPLAEVGERVAGGAIVDATTIVSLLLAQRALSPA